MSRSIFVRHSERAPVMMGMNTFRRMTTLGTMILLLATGCSSAVDGPPAEPEVTKPVEISQVQPETWNEYTKCVYACMRACQIIKDAFGTNRDCGSYCADNCTVQ